MRRMFSKNQIKDIVEQGNLNVDGSISGDEIIENMSGYSFIPNETGDGFTMEHIYAGVVKNGNKITFVSAFKITKTADQDYHKLVGSFIIPSDLMDKLYPTEIDGRDILDIKVGGAFASQNSFVSQQYGLEKLTDKLVIRLYNARTNLTTNTEYFIRCECTLLLSENLIPE